MNKKRGIIGTIVLIVIALIILGYYNISFQSLVESHSVQDNLLYAWNLVVWAAENGFHWLVVFVRDHLPNAPTM